MCDCNYITAVWFYINPGIVFDNYKVKIQLEEGSAAPPAKIRVDYQARVKK